MDSHVHAKDKPVDEIDGTAAQEGEETSATQRLLEQGGDPIVRISYGAMQDPAGRQADVDEALGELATPHTVGLDRDLNSRNVIFLVFSTTSSRKPKQLIVCV